MKKSFVTLFIFCSYALCGQINLIPNSGFDSISTCPSGPGEIYKAPPWVDPNTGSSDLYDTCSTNNLCTIPSNSLGVQMPYNGCGYSGIVTYVPSSTDHREYIQVQLRDSLIGGKIYNVSFRVSRGDYSKYATDGIGAYFSSSPVSCGGCFLPYTAQINNTPGNIITDTLSWITIQQNFIAQGGEKYMTIGNFNHDSNTAVSLRYPSAFYVVAYYYVDDVSVTDIGWSGIGENSISKYSLFPNPSDGGFHLQGNFPDKTELHVYDIIGNEVITPTSISSGEQTISLQLQLGEGIYFYRISSQGEILGEDRLMIVK